MFSPLCRVSFGFPHCVALSALRILVVRHTWFKCSSMIVLQIIVYKMNRDVSFHKHVIFYYVFIGLKLEFIFITCFEGAQP